MLKFEFVFTFMTMTNVHVEYMPSHIMSFFLVISAVMFMPVLVLVLALVLVLNTYHFTFVTIARISAIHLLHCDAHVVSAVHVDQLQGSMVMLSKE